jgi:hypothetical protein
MTLDAVSLLTVHIHPTPMPQMNANRYVRKYWFGPVATAAKIAVVTIRRHSAIMELRIGSSLRLKKLEMDAPGTLPHNINRIAIPFSVAVNCNWSVK